MKRLLLPTLFLLLSIACSSDDENATRSENESYVLRLDLVSSIPGNPSSSDATKTTGSAMEFQEYYSLDQEGAFMRHRERDGKTIEETGMYERGQWENKIPFIKFTYPDDSRLRGSCEVGNTEYLYLQENGLYKNEWGACDGTFLEYQVQEKK